MIFRDDDNYICNNQVAGADTTTTSIAHCTQYALELGGGFFNYNTATGMCHPKASGGKCTAYSFGAGYEAYGIATTLASYLIYDDGLSLCNNPSLATLSGASFADCEAHTLSLGGGFFNYHGATGACYPKAKGESCIKITHSTSYNGYSAFGIRDTATSDPAKMKVDTCIHWYDKVLLSAKGNHDINGNCGSYGCKVAKAASTLTFESVYTNTNGLQIVPPVHSPKTANDCVFAEDKFLLASGISKMSGTSSVLFGSND
eukprot:Awhi_evm1s5285